MRTRKCSGKHGATHCIRKYLVPVIDVRLSRHLHPFQGAIERRDEGQLAGPRAQITQLLFIPLIAPSLALSTSAQPSQTRPRTYRTIPPDVTLHVLIFPR
jgi:hypothetical protein